MSSLEIRSMSGKVEKRKLTKTQPVSVGRHGSNDVCIDEDDVSAMHCRISWSENHYEVSAANPEGVDLNGTLIRHAALRTGDVLRVGSIDIVFKSDEPPVADAAPASDSAAPESQEIKLAPVSSDVIPSFFERPESSLRNIAEPAMRQRRPDESGRAGKPSQERSSGRRPAAPDKIDLDALDDDEHDTPEDHDSRRADRDAGGRASAAGDEPFVSRSMEYSGIEESRSTRTGGTGLKDRLGVKAVRPGERQVLRSPLVLACAGVALFLLLLSLILGVSVGRLSERNAYEAAVAEFGQGKYTQAIQLFEEFVRDYPRGEFTDLALLGLGKARIEREISGAAPAWPRGLEQLQEFIRLHRDRPNFRDLHKEIRSYAERISLGAAASAGSLRRRDLLGVSVDAQKVLASYSPDGQIPPELNERIQLGQRAAEAAIIKQETFEEHIAAIETALDKPDPMQALRLRVDLLARYPEFRGESRVAALLARTLDTERSLVTREEIDRDALTNERERDVPPAMLLAAHTRSRTADRSQGRSVIALAKDCCYGIDTVTGLPVWRRVIGADTPFFPMAASTTVAALLLYDTNHGELTLIDRNSGELIWRQPLDEPLAGPPLIHESQVYQPTMGNRLYKIDLETGRIATGLRFSQQVLAPPVLVSGGMTIVVAGDQDVIYTLSSRELECRSVNYIGHRSGSIDAPLMSMGSLVLMIENDRPDSALLRVLQAGDEQSWLQQAAQARVEGQVHDPPILRGRQLLVTSTPERMTAFSVSDDGEQRTLSQVARAQIPTAQAGPMFLTAGPDGEFWVASSAVRKFRLKTESIQPVSNAIAVGLSAQPLQSIGQQLFIGRRNLWYTAVLFSQADRDEMISHWSTTLGAHVLEWANAGDDSVVCLCETGDVFRISAAEVLQGGSRSSSSTRLQLPDATEEPLSAAELGNGQILAFASKPQPAAWLVNSAGQIERQLRLREPLEAAPVRLAPGVVLPLPGRLHLVPLGSDGTQVEDFLAPVDTEQSAHWTQLAALDAEQLIAVNDHGRVARIQLRATPSPAHLAEAVTRQLDTPVDVGMHVDDGKLVLADSGGRLLVLDASTMETLAEAQLDMPASNSVFGSAGMLLVESGRTELVCFALSDKLQPLWKIPLDGAGLAGAPYLFDDRFLIAKQNGQVLAVDRATGEIMHTIDVNQRITQGIRPLGSLLVVPVADGGIVRVESILETGR